MKQSSPWITILFQLGTLVENAFSADDSKEAVKFKSFVIFSAESRLLCSFQDMKAEWYNPHVQIHEANKTKTKLCSRVDMPGKRSKHPKSDFTCRDKERNPNTARRRRRSNYI